MEAVLGLLVLHGHELLLVLGVLPDLGAVALLPVALRPPAGRELGPGRELGLGRVDDGLHAFGLVVGPRVVGLRLVQDGVVLLDDGVVGVRA